MPRRLTCLLAGLLLATVGGAAVRADMPLVLSPTEEGARLAAEVEGQPAALAAELQVPLQLEQERFGGALSFDLDGLSVGGAIRGDLGAAFGRPSELRAAGAGILADWLGKATGLAVARSSDALAVSLALARDARESGRTRALVAAQVDLHRDAHRLTLRTGRRGAEEDFIGAEACAPLGGAASVTLVGAVERGPQVQRSAGVAVEWKAALFPGDRLRAQARETRTSSKSPDRQIGLRYGTPLPLGRLAIEGVGRPTARDYRARAQWRLLF